MSSHPTEDDCKKGLEQSSEQFLKLPGVGGIGVGHTYLHGSLRCCINVYIESPGPHSIPATVNVKVPPGKTVSIPVVVICQGTLLY